jgi:hypothetical protein
VHFPDFRALFLRKTFPELREVMDRSHGTFKRLGAEWIASEKRWRFPSGAYYEFGYCESWADVQQYQGQQYQYIAFDELGLLPEERIWVFLMTRCRSTNPKINRFMRASANPGGAGHGWLKRRFISTCKPNGEIYFVPGTDPPLTRAFVQSRVWDNPSIVENDPQYISILKALPPAMRAQLLEGDWNAGTGLAFERLTAATHMVEPFRVEGWESPFAAIDWGYSHNYSVGIYLPKPGNRVYKVDTIISRRHNPEQIVERVRERLLSLGLDFYRLQYTVAGSDVKIVEKARGNTGPSVMEQFFNAGWPVIQADQSRISGYQNMLHYFDWDLPTSENPYRPPLFQMMDTPGNRKCLDQLQEMVVDPDGPNDVLKVDADYLTGEGGDDCYDETRYALMSRPLLAKRPTEHYDRVHRGETMDTLRPPQNINTGKPVWAVSNPKPPWLKAGKGDRTTEGA